MNNLKTFCLTFRNLCHSLWGQMSTICHLQLWSTGCSMNCNNNISHNSNSNINSSSRMEWGYQHPPGLWPSPTTRCQAWPTRWTPGSTTLHSLFTPRFIPPLNIYSFCVYGWDSFSKIWMTDELKYFSGECWGYSQSAGRDAVQWS